MIGENFQFDRVWSILDRSHPKKMKKWNGHFHPLGECDNFLELHFLTGKKSNLTKFDPFWTQNKTIIFILLINVTTYYSKIFWLMRNPFWSSLIKFDPFWTILDRSDPKKPKIKCHGDLGARLELNWIHFSFLSNFHRDRYMKLEKKN